jgi:hypothetical protein
MAGVLFCLHYEIRSSSYNSVIVASVLFCLHHETAVKYSQGDKKSNLIHSKNWSSGENTGIQQLSLPVQFFSFRFSWKLEAAAQKLLVLNQEITPAGNVSPPLASPSSMAFSFLRSKFFRAWEVQDKLIER